MPARNRPIAERFWEKVKKSNGCWEWQSIRNAYGYGVFCNGPHGPGRRFMAHRIAYELTYGPFDPALYVCHTCDNHPCVRPDHLFLGTQKENMRDCAAKGRVKNGLWDRPFSVIGPDGSRIDGVNLTRFSRENDLCRVSMFAVVRGTCKNHRGYTKAPTE